MHSVSLVNETLIYVLQTLVFLKRLWSSLYGHSSSVLLYTFTFYTLLCMLRLKPSGKYLSRDLSLIHFLFYSLHKACARFCKQNNHLNSAQKVKKRALNVNTFNHWMNLNNLWDNIKYPKIVLISDQLIWVVLKD